MRSWLLEEPSLHGSDQFATRFGEEVQISWFGEPPKIDPGAHQKWRKTENIDWSPLGTYLVVYHQLGVQLWGGPNWTKQKTFKHQGVVAVQFSPCEKYLVTFSPDLAAADVKTLLFFLVNFHRNQNESHKEFFYGRFNQAKRFEDFHIIQNLRSLNGPLMINIFRN